jgi:predicted NBD/HSP70 family sugar kinase
MGLTVPDLIRRAREGDERARAAILETARYLGIGLGGIINAVNPARIVLGGEITAAWEMVEPALRCGIRERSLTAASALTPVVPEEVSFPRLRGATALVVAPVFAAPRVA